MAPAEAAGAEWRLGRVHEWLASGRRVLVVAGGAGEGKSTVSATLVASQKGQAHGARGGRRPEGARPSPLLWRS